MRLDSPPPNTGAGDAASGSWLPADRAGVARLFATRSDRLVRA